jgi:hypothetical protein
MPRNLSPDFIDQLLSTGAASPIRFAMFEFENETIYVCDGIGITTPLGPAYSALSTFPYGQAFTGLGWLGTISTVPQTTKVQAQNVTFSLSGIVVDFVTEAVNQVRITDTATLWLGFVDDTGAVIADPVQLFSGSLDVPSMTDFGQASTLSITAENPLVRLQEAPNRSFDDADQQINYPGDLGFSFVDALNNLTLFWPTPYTVGSPYPISMGLTPVGSDIAVGGTVQISAQINYSDGSDYIVPAHTGGGIPINFYNFASSNPKVATVSNTGLVTGVSAGACAIMVRIVSPLPVPSTPGGQYRAACALIVHS